MECVSEDIEEILAPITFKLPGVSSEIVQTFNAQKFELWENNFPMCAGPNPGTVLYGAKHAHVTGIAVGQGYIDNAIIGVMLIECNILFCNLLVSCSVEAAQKELVGGQ